MGKYFLFWFWLFILGWASVPASGWGFAAHRQINRLAVFGLPPEMVSFYKYHIAYLTENAVNPDRRRYAVPGEAARHYIDLEAYGDSALFRLPATWKQAVALYTADTLLAHGIVPWCILQVKYQLTEAFRQRNKQRILALSADLGHYVADCHVPLHTTHNYDGQLTGQRGIHALWEGRLPELFARQYDFWTGQAQYMRHPARQVWQALAQAHGAVDSVLRFERELTTRFAADKKYSFETKGGVTQRVYAQAFATAYHQRLQGQVERQMRMSIQMVRDMWYTCWVDAGQPDLEKLLEGADLLVLPDDSLHPQQPGQHTDSLQVRPHETETGHLPESHPPAVPARPADLPVSQVCVLQEIILLPERLRFGLDARGGHI